MKKICDSEELPLLSNIEYGNQRLLALIRKVCFINKKETYRVVELGVDIYFQ